jgi:chorismate mutase
MEKKLLIRNEKPFIISGPCSAETEEQLITTALQLKDNVEFDLLRAGIWKPRTRPDSFEGVGVVGLSWLVNAGKTIGKPTATEVANAKHVEAALNAGIDVLWIGARTTANPFAVQEIADALKGVEVPILIKNPVNPDLDLWVGAFERIDKAGIKEIGAIHRGFSVYKPNVYRNIPSWEIPIALTEKIPGIFLLNDPSHIAGKSELVAELSQKALDLNFDV